MFSWAASDTGLKPMSGDNAIGTRSFRPSNGTSVPTCTNVINRENELAGVDEGKICLRDRLAASVAWWADVLTGWHVDPIRCHPAMWRIAGHIEAVAYVKGA
jgi:hypothetical protein